MGVYFNCVTCLHSPVLSYAAEFRILSTEQQYDFCLSSVQLIDESVGHYAV